VPLTLVTVVPPEPLEPLPGADASALEPVETGAQPPASLACAVLDASDEPSPSPGCEPSPTGAAHAARLTRGSETRPTIHERIALFFVLLTP
jgi:hypothetical protein